MIHWKAVLWGVLVLIVIQWLVHEKLLRARKRLPPGPTSFPIIGNLHNLSKKPHKSLAELAKIHGPLMLLRLGFLNVVVVSSPEVAREVLQKKEVHFSDRSVPDCIRTRHIVDNSIAMMPVCNRWRTARRIANTLLLSSKTLDANQNTRLKKIKDLVSYVNNCSDAGVVVDIGQLAFETSLNLLSNTFFSMDLADPNSELSREFKRLTWCIISDFIKPNLADFFPVFSRVDPQGLRRRMTSHYRKLFKIFDTIIDKRLAAPKCREHKSDDVLDALLQICHDKSDDFELSQIHHMLMDLFLAGTETTSNTIEWAMAELLHEPKKLRTTQNELRRVVGRGKFIKEADFAQLPYLQAVVKETFRLHPPGPLLIPRKADSDIDVDGFKIPKDSKVLVNIWAIGRDSNIWRNPNEFEPERFLNSQVDVKGNHFELIPFGSGRRICAGIPLATRMLPLMLGNLVNFFDWKLPNGMKPQEMEMDDKFGMVLKKATPLLVIPTNASI